MKLTGLMLLFVLTAGYASASYVFAADDPWLRENGIEVPTFSDALVPVQFEKASGGTLKDGGRWQGALDLLLYSIKGEPLTVTIEAGNIYKDRPPLKYRFTKPDGSNISAWTDLPSTGNLPVDGKQHVVVCDVPEPGLYRLYINDHNAGWRLTGTRRDCPLVMTLNGRKFHHHGYTSLEYFYVPKGTRDVVYFWNGGKHSVETPNGTRTAVPGTLEKRSKFVKIPVPQGMDGKVWKFHYMNLDSVHFVTCPDILAFSPSGLMVPKELVENDGLQLR